ncbi:MAG: TorF family putative porin, partial [Rhodospirillaceae bacterium]
DAGVEYTTYPGAPKALRYSYYDAFASLGAGLGPVFATATARYTPDYSGATGRAAFFDLSGEVPIAFLFKATAAVGYADLRPAAGGKYRYWSVGLGADWLGFTAAVRYHGSDLRDCRAPCGDRVVFSLGRTF